jgi:hypothetical protein
VVIVSARTEDRWFDSRQGVSFLDFKHCSAVLCNFVGIVIVYLREINVKKYFNSHECNLPYKNDFIFYIYILHRGISLIETIGIIRLRGILCNRIGHSSHLTARL